MSKRSNKSDNSKRQQPVQQQRAQAAQARTLKKANPNENLQQAEKEYLRETPAGGKR